MSGVDTVRGINYQHCHALHTALEIAADSVFTAMRVEGTDDVLDIEIHGASPQGAGNSVLLHGLQIKSRTYPYTWARAELLSIVRRWAGRPHVTSSEFTLVTDGDLGPSGQAVTSALKDASIGNFDAIAALLEVHPNDPLCHIAARASIVSDPASVEALLLSAEHEVRARIADGPSHPDAQAESESRVNELFVLISTRSGLTDPDQRMITREEILEVLGGLSQLSEEDRWSNALGLEYTAAARAHDVSSIIDPSIRVGPTQESISIEKLSKVQGPVLLTGRTGSGKSTLARLWRTRAAAAGDRLVVCQAEWYLPGRLDRAVADAVGDVVRRSLPREVGRQVLGDSGATIVIDGVSEVPPLFRKKLAEELQTHLAGSHGARIVLLGRDEGVCASTLPASQRSSRLFPSAFGHAQQFELARRVLSESRSFRATDIEDADRPTARALRRADAVTDHECRVALAQAEHALGDAAGNPLLLRLALELVATGIEFTNRASIFELTVDRMAARTNVAEIRVASAALGIIFAELLDDGRRFANPLEWSRLLLSACNALSAAGVPADVEEISAAVARSGLVNASVDGVGQTRLHVPVHDSFADYFAARAHADRLVELPALLNSSDESRVVLSGQMSRLTEPDYLAVAEALPFTLVRLSEFDSREVDGQAPGLISGLLNAVLPSDDQVGVLMWWVGDRPVAQMCGGEPRWVEESSAPDLFANISVIGEPDQGPIVLAVRLWRLLLRNRLQETPVLQGPRPKSTAEACTQLTSHLADTGIAVLALLGRIASGATRDRLEQAVGPLGMTGIVYDRHGDEFGPPGWIVKYVKTSESDLHPSPDDGERSDVYAAEFFSSSDVGSILSTSPWITASSQVSEAINELARPNWI